MPTEIPFKDAVHNVSRVSLLPAAMNPAMLASGSRQNANALLFAATQDRLHDYGLNLGYAFQIADDVLDYASDAATLGKNLGDDLAEGKATLPLIHAMQHSDAATQEVLRNAIEQGDTDALPQVLAAIHACGSLDYSRERALQYARDAEASLSGLGDNEFVAALRGLAQYSVNRDH